MLPIIQNTGRIAQVLTQGYVEGKPFKFVVMFKELYQDQEIVDSWVCQLWPRSEEAYNMMHNRIYVGNLITITGTPRTGNYQDQSGNWKASPHIAVKSFDILDQRNPEYANKDMYTGGAARKKRTGASTTDGFAPIPKLSPTPTPSVYSDEDDDLPF
jgi:single-stranded DNA-binding protein